MIRVEFFQKLDALCPQDEENERVEEKRRINEWMDRSYFKADDLQRLYYAIEEDYGYKKYPRLPTVKKIWLNLIEEKGESRPRSSEDDLIRDKITQAKMSWYGYGVDEIIKAMKKIRSAGLRNASDIDVIFYAEFEPLLSEYFWMRQNNMPFNIIFDKLTYVKECIKEKREYTSSRQQIFEPELTDERIGRVEKFSGVDGKILDGIM